MIGQLRTYTINKGMMGSWLKLFSEQIVPLLKDAGIGIHSAWVNKVPEFHADERTQFIWIRTFDNAADLEAKESAFYGSAWWTENVDFVRGHLAHREISVIEPFLPDKL